MSGLFALVKPRRIKASHRRRRKVASGQSVQRYYDPQIGRFLSVDPVAAYSKKGILFNRYWYANNNPYKFTDPDGRIVKIVGENMERLVEQAKKDSPIAAQQLKSLEESPNTHTIQQETGLKSQSNANNTGSGAFVQADGKPGAGSGSVVSVKTSTEKVEMRNEPGGKVSAVAVSNTEKLVHEMAHAMQMDSGTLREPAGPNEQANRAANEDYAKAIENMYRQEQGLQGRRL